MRASWKILENALRFVPGTGELVLKLSKSEFSGAESSAFLQKRTEKLLFYPFVHYWRNQARKTGVKEQ